MTGKTYDFPPKAIRDPEGNRLEVTDTQGMGSVLVLDSDENPSIPWIMVADVATDWEVIEE